MAKTSIGHEAEKIIQEVLKINPRPVSALEILAEMSIEDDLFDTEDCEFISISTVSCSQN